jgi:hypothetical protein
MKFTIPGFWGGIGNTAYEPLSTQTYRDARNLDVFKYTNKLSPGNKLVERALDPVIATTEASTFFPASDGKLYFLGDTGTSNRLRVYSSTIGPTFTLTTVGSSTSNSSHPSPFDNAQTNNTGQFSMAELNGYLLFWEGTALSRVLLSGPTYASDPYSWTAASTTARGPIFVHEGLRKAFIVDANTIRTLDSTTVSGSADPTLALTIDPKYVIRSMCPYGRFVAIGLQAKSDADTSKVLMWDGSATTVEDSIDVGDVGLQAIRNVGGVLHVLVCRFTFGDLNNYTRIYLGDGPRFTLADELHMDTASTAISTAGGIKYPFIINDSSVTVAGDRMYWGYNGYYNQANYSGLLGITNGIYCYGKLEVNQPRVLTLAATTATTAGNHNVTCIRVVNNNLYLTYAGQEVSTNTYHFENQLDNYVSSELTPGIKSSGGIYESNIFPVDTKIKSVRINHDSLPASTGFTVQVKHYGHYTRGTSVPSEDSYATLFTSEGNTATSGMSQSTTNTTYTVLEDPNVFKTARYAQIKILFDETSTIYAPTIVFPIFIETE